MRNPRRSTVGRVFYTKHWGILGYLLYSGHLTPQAGTSKEINFTQDTTAWRHSSSSSVHRENSQLTPESNVLPGALPHAWQLTQKTESFPGILLHKGKQKPQSLGPSGEQLHRGQELDCFFEDPKFWWPPRSSITAKETDQQLHFCSEFPSSWKVSL